MDCKMAAIVSQASHADSIQHGRREILSYVSFLELVEKNKQTVFPEIL